MVLLRIKLLQITLACSVDCAVENVRVNFNGLLEFLKIFNIVKFLSNYQEQMIFEFKKQENLTKQL